MDDDPEIKEREKMSEWQEIDRERERASKEKITLCILP